MILHQNTALVKLEVVFFASVNYSDATESKTVWVHREAIAAKT